MNSRDSQFTDRSDRMRAARPESGSLVTRKDLPTPLYVLPQNAVERTVRCEGPMATRMRYRQERDFPTAYHPGRKGTLAFAV